jgi:transposase
MRIMGDYYKEGLNHKQQLLFPPSLDEYVSGDNPVRAIDAYVSLVEWSELGFADTRKSSRSDGQKAYHPTLQLKIYLYGYLNKIRSSRALEKECGRNIELMWLTEGLKPSYKTIADFRKNNPKALKEVFREFVLLCRNVELIEGEVVAVDGAFLRANASKNQLIMKKGALRELAKAETEVEEYLRALEYSDKEPLSSSSASLSAKLPDELEKLGKRKKN